MNLTDVIYKRHSVRKYRMDMAVPDELVSEIIELAKEAPSAGGMRAYRVFITRLKVTNQVDCPVYLVICSDPDKSASRYGDRGRDLYSLQDATIFGAYVQLVAVDKGLSSVWIGAFNEGRVKKLLDISGNLRPVAIICLGYKL